MITLCLTSSPPPPCKPCTLLLDATSKHACSPAHLRFRCSCVRPEWQSWLRARVAAAWAAAVPAWSHPRTMITLCLTSSPPCKPCTLLLDATSRHACSPAHLRFRCSCVRPRWQSWLQARVAAAWAAAVPPWNRPRGAGATHIAHHHLHMQQQPQQQQQHGSCSLYQRIHKQFYPHVCPYS